MMQTSVAMSTEEAEVFAISDCVRDTKWVRQVLKEMDVENIAPTLV